MQSLRINRNCLDSNGSGYIELYGVCRAHYAVARPKSASFPGTYRHLPEITAVYLTSDDIPTGGELFDTATRATRYSDALVEYGEPVWPGSDKDWILEFPGVTVFLMSLASDDIYRKSYEDVATVEQSVIME
ncbi:MAG: hypothetical protein J4428_05115 [Candidatus Aenigmarchaeota archaeon]|nr:hypothetical protein [Candidatus Aenigmarchaeota archaeon]